MKKFISGALIALAVLVAGCTRDNPQGEENDGKGILKVTLKNAAGSTRMGGEEPEQETENTVSNFTVYVFNNSSGALEKSATFTDINEDAVIEGLGTASAKKIVALVNCNPNNIPDVGSYDELAAMTIDLTTQELTIGNLFGLFMSGEVSPVTLTAGEENENKVTIPVRRVVAKVRLASLTVSPSGDPDEELGLFTITGVSMQLVPSKAYMLGNTYTVTEDDDPKYAGGVVIGENPLSDYRWANLYDPYSLPTDYASGILLNPGLYYYVSPNDAVGNHITLLTISGTYAGNPAYYTFAVNNEDMNDPDTNLADGTFIKRNMIYNLHVTLNNLSLYADTPDSINEQAIVTVAIDIADWEGELTQNVSW